MPIAITYPVEKYVSIIYLENFFILNNHSLHNTKNNIIFIVELQIHVPNVKEVSGFDVSSIFVLNNYLKQVQKYREFQSIFDSGTISGA